jgi:drug/metabolite transporter (DMT)-like permease
MLTNPNETAPFQMLRMSRSCVVHLGYVYLGVVSWGLLGAFAAAVAYGAATILQAVGARSNGTTDDLDMHLVTRLVHSSTYIVGLLLDGLGFGLSFAALRTLPLFTVQAIVASGLAVTAVIAVTLGARPSLPEWLALGVVTVGLVLLGLSAHTQRATVLGDTDRFLLVASVVAVGVVAFLVVRRRAGSTPQDGWLLGGMAGLLYGGAGIAARILRHPRHPWDLLTDPAVWGLVSAGVLGLLIYAMALQRGRVTTVTSAVVVTETVVPAIVGVVFLGDRPGHGGTAMSALGFALCVAGALTLARYGEAPPGMSEPHDRTDLSAAVPG